jgi:hypothetical protein
LSKYKFTPSIIVFLKIIQAVVLFDRWKLSTHHQPDCALRGSHLFVFGGRLLQLCRFFCILAALALARLGAAHSRVEALAVAL